MVCEEPTAAGPAGRLQFSAGHWAALWGSPHPELAGKVVTPDIVASWPGDAAPVCGLTAYKLRVARLLDRIPDLRLEVTEHAQAGDVLFVRWVASGSVGHSTVSFTGVDRILLRDGLVKDHRVYYDPTRLEQVAGGQAGGR